MGGYGHPCLICPMIITSAQFILFFYSAADTAHGSVRPTGFMIKNPSDHVEITTQQDQCCSNVLLGQIAFWTITFSAL